MSLALVIAASGEGGNEEWGLEGRLLMREGVGFGCYQHGARSGCDQHTATAMTTLVEGQCTLALREMLRAARLDVIAIRRGGG